MVWSNESDLLKYLNISILPVRPKKKLFSFAFARIGSFSGRPLGVAEEGEEDESADAEDDQDDADRPEICLGESQWDDDDDEHDNIEDKACKETEESRTLSFRLAC